MKHFLLLSSIIMVGCGLTTDLRQQSANQIARPAFMSERFIEADGFKLKTWERMHQNGAAAMVYIEGDSQVIGSTTPHTPVALMLASRDGASNLAYLARPCQFIKFPEQKGCDDSYWTDNLYTEEIISAYETALNDIVSRYNLNGLHLVGYDGGANIAAVLTARNKNILSLRTVAGNLNPELTQGKVLRMTAEGEMVTPEPLASRSLYAIDFGTELANVPQIHFIGGRDTLVTPDIYHSYRQAVGLSSCITSQLVPDAAHIRGWQDQWPDLIGIVPACDESYKNLPLPAPTPTDAEIPQTLYKELAK